MNRTLKSLLFVLGLMYPGLAAVYSQGAAACTHMEYYSDSRAYCTDLSPDDVIAMGVLQVVDTQDGQRKVILLDEVYGQLELLLTRGLIQAIDESPVESFEVEGTITDGRMTVKSLRPIE